MTAFEKTFSFIGLLGFSLLLPGILYAVGYSDLANTCATYLGEAGDLSVMTVIGFILMGLAIFFGGGENITATLLGLLIGFFLVSTAVTVGFMQWFRDFSQSIPFLANTPLNYFSGIAIILLGLVLSFFKNIKFTPQLVILLVLPLLFLASANTYGFLQFESGFQLSMNDGFHKLSGIIDKKYQSMPAVKRYVDELLADDELSEEEKREKIEALKGRIEKQEDDRTTLAELQKENERYKKLLEEQQNALKGASWCQSARDTSAKVNRIEEAVRPQQPCVRDFAVSLAKSHAGTYNSNAEHSPSAQGIKQIAAIHVHLSAKWQYISDPISVLRDFFSPADRTLALGLAGDCDDFSIIMASAIEAVGGVSRIMGGTCSGGAHAWAEVYIGDKSAWEEASSQLKQFYNEPNKAIAYSQDREGNYWLPLDWRLGEFTCNDGKTQQIYNMNKRLEIQMKQDLAQIGR